VVKSLGQLRCRESDRQNSSATSSLPPYLAVAFLVIELELEFTLLGWQIWRLI
jgi:hypothetical protein